jgi:hypothetical protein
MVNIVENINLFLDFLSFYVCGGSDRGELVFNRAFEAVIEGATVESGKG